MPHSPHLPHLLQQVYFACGLLVLLFELAAVPYLTPWLGVKLSQRLGSLFEVPVYILFPLVSRMGGGGLPVTLTVMVLLFTSYVCTNSVSACLCWICCRGRRRQLMWVFDDVAVAAVEGSGLFVVDA